MRLSQAFGLVLQLDSLSDLTSVPMDARYLEFSDTMGWYHVVLLHGDVTYLLDFRADDSATLAGWEEARATRTPYTAKETRLVPTTDVGLAAVQTRDLPIGCEPLVQSWKLETPPRTLGVLDVWIGGSLLGLSGKCYLKGGQYEFTREVAEDSAVHFGIVDRDDVLGVFAQYGLRRTRLYVEDASGFQVGETISAGDASTRVLGIGDGFLEIRHYICTEADLHTTIPGGALVTGALSGAQSPARVDNPVEEGDLIFPKGKIVKDNYIFGMAFRNFSQEIDGSDEVPAGLYFHAMVWNEGTLNSAKAYISLTLGRL